jgi:hypothetical protein
MADEEDELDWRGRKAGVIPIPDEFVPFAQELHAESDRGMALSGTAYLDDRLGKLIEAYLTPDTGAAKLIWDGTAPLATFSARIAMGHALGLITDKERNELNMLRKVRNLFAHDFKVRMDDAVVIGTMGNFKELTDVVWSGLATLLDVKFAETPRDRFFHAVMRLAHQLDVRKWVIEDEAMRLLRIDWREHYF